MNSDGTPRKWFTRIRDEAYDAARENQAAEWPGRDVRIVGRPQLNSPAIVHVLVSDLELLEVPTPVRATVGTDEYEIGLRVEANDAGDFGVTEIEGVRRRDGGFIAADALRVLGLGGVVDQVIDLVAVRLTRATSSTTWWTRTTGTVLHGSPGAHVVMRKRGRQPEPDRIANEVAIAERACQSVPPNVSRIAHVIAELERATGRPVSRRTAQRRISAFEHELARGEHDAES